MGVSRLQWADLYLGPLIGLQPRGFSGFLRKVRKYPRSFDIRMGELGPYADLNWRAGQTGCGPTSCSMLAICVDAVECWDLLWENCRDVCVRLSLNTVSQRKPWRTSLHAPRPATSLDATILELQYVQYSTSSSTRRDKC